MDLHIVICVCNSESQIVFKHLSKEEVQAGAGVKLQICAGCQEINANCVIISSLHQRFLHWHSFESLRLVRMDYFLRWGPAALEAAMVESSI